MSFDPALEFITAKNKFADARGVDPPKGLLHADSGQPIIAGSKAVPRTTWGDVFLFGRGFRIWADPNHADCVSLRKAEGASSHLAQTLCVFGHPHAQFVHTKEYKRADKLWEQWNPFNILSKSVGPYSAATELTTKLLTPVVFPFNEEFWGYGLRYAIARGGAGAVPSRFQIAVESVVESVAELPQNVGNALSAATKFASGVLPDFSDAISLLKWSSILGGGALLYWYALRPKPKVQK